MLILLIYLQSGFLVEKNYQKIMEERMRTIKNGNCSVISLSTPPQNTDLALDGGRELVSGSTGVNNFNNRN